nr:hypothetical protein [Tanacetum cinerariifolium]
PRVHHRQLVFALYRHGFVRHLLRHRGQAAEPHARPSAEGTEAAARERADREPAARLPLRRPVSGGEPRLPAGPFGLHGFPVSARALGDGGPHAARSQALRAGRGIRPARCRRARAALRGHRFAPDSGHYYHAPREGVARPPLP